MFFCRGVVSEKAPFHKRNRYCTVKALKREDQTIFKEDLLTGIKREFRKDGVVLV